MVEGRLRTGFPFNLFLAALEFLANLTFEHLGPDRLKFVLKKSMSYNFNITFACFEF